MLIGADKQVLFRILKYSLEEFKDMESEEDSVLGYGKIFYTGECIRHVDGAA